MNSVASHPQPAQTVTPDKKILVVDDDPGILTMTCAMLQATGYSTLVAASGEEGLDIYRNSKGTDSPVDLVLLDLTLPGGMSGIETLDYLLQFDTQAQVIATSGYFEETATAAQAARQRGFQGILPKPYTSERLLRLVQVSLSRVAA